jgi:hypothetical protein
VRIRACLIQGSQNRTQLGSATGAKSRHRIVRGRLDRHLRQVEFEQHRTPAEGSEVIASTVGGPGPGKSDRKAAAFIEDS